MIGDDGAGAVLGLPVDWVLEHALLWGGGVTALLAVGWLVGLRCRRAERRQHAAELAVAASLLWALLATLPLPRLWNDWTTAAGQPVLGAEPLEPLESPRRPPPSTTAIEVAEQPAVPPGVPRAAVVDAASAPAPRHHLAEPLDLLGMRPSSPATNGGGARWLVAALLLGSLGWVLFGLLGVWRLARLRRAAIAPPEWLVGELGAAQRAAPWIADVRVRVVAGLRSPLCCGWRRPVVLLPRALCEPEMRAVLWPVLWHELQHARQRDPRGRALFAAAAPALYAHPLFWVLRRRAELASEQRADRGAAARVGTAAYLRALLALCERPARCTNGLQGVAPMAGARSQLLKRMDMLARRKNSMDAPCSVRERWGAVVGTTALVLAMAATFGVRPAVAQDPERRPSAEQPSVRPIEAEPMAESKPEVTYDESVEYLELGERIRVLHAELERLLQRQAELEAPGTAVAPADRVAAFQPVAEEPAARDPLVARPGSGGRRDPVTNVGIGRGAVASDLIDLVTRTIESRGATELAKARLALVNARSASGVIGSEEVHVAEIDYQVARDKFEALRGIARAELEVAKSEVEVLEKQLDRSRVLAKRGFITATEVARDESSLVRARTRLEVLAGLF